jgi:hypothetical protein
MLHPSELRCTLKNIFFAPPPHRSFAVPFGKIGVSTNVLYIRPNFFVLSFLLFFDVSSCYSLLIPLFFLISTFSSLLILLFISLLVLLFLFFSYSSSYYYSLLIFKLFNALQTFILKTHRAKLHT